MEFGNPVRAVRARPSEMDNRSREDGEFCASSKCEALRRGEEKSMAVATGAFYICAAMKKKRGRGWGVGEIWALPPRDGGRRRGGLSTHDDSRAAPACGRRTRAGGTIIVSRGVDLLGPSWQWEREGGLACGPQGWWLMGHSGPAGLVLA
jgi:hypothetical protein